MTATSVSRGQARGKTFVPPIAPVPLPQHEQGAVLFRLGYSLGVCATDAQAVGWLEAEAASAAGKEAHRG